MTIKNKWQLFPIKLTAISFCLPKATSSQFPMLTNNCVRVFQCKSALGFNFSAKDIWSFFYFNNIDIFLLFYYQIKGCIYFSLPFLFRYEETNTRTEIHACACFKQNIDECGDGRPSRRVFLSARVGLHRERETQKRTHTHAHTQP